MEIKSIHTLDARDNIMLAFIRESFNLSSECMLREIQYLRSATENALWSKGISYDALKNSLVPDRQRQEIALVFDTSAIESACYGYEVFRHLIPIFDKNSNHSILVGDCINWPKSNESFYSNLIEVVDLRRKFRFEDPKQFYIVYVNNVTESMIKRLDEGLGNFDAYIGFSNTTYNSVFKFYLSTILVHLCIKSRKVIIQGHPPDCDDCEDLNICGYPFEENGFVCRSISEDLSDVMLSYKIERPILSGFESDTWFSLNAVSSSPSSFEDFEVQVDDAKLQYLKTKKAGSMSRAGIEGVDINKLANLVKRKINNNYIYNISFNAEYNVVKFNIILEVRASKTGIITRLLAALAYLPERKTLRLITLY